MKKPKYNATKVFGIFWNRRNLVIESVTFSGDEARRSGVKMAEERNRPLEHSTGDASGIISFTSLKLARAYRKSLINPKLFAIRPMTIKYQTK